MGRLLFFMGLIFLVLLIGAIIEGKIKAKNNENPVKLMENQIKYNSEYYWYNKPHYHIMSNGEMINIPDYVSWDDWKNYSQEKRNRICIQIEARILSTRNNNKQNIDNKEIIKFN